LSEQACVLDGSGREIGFYERGLDSVGGRRIASAEQDRFLDCRLLSEARKVGRLEPLFCQAFRHRAVQASLKKLVRSRQNGGRKPVFVKGCSSRKKSR